MNWLVIINLIIYFIIAGIIAGILERISKEFEYVSYLFGISWPVSIPALLFMEMIKWIANKVKNFGKGE